MSERKDLATLIFVSALIGAIGFMIINSLSVILSEQQDVRIRKYRVNIYPNGTLVEQFTYEVNIGDKYRMFYRYWEVPLSIHKLNEPYVEYIRSFGPDGAIPYIKDHGGLVFAATDDRLRLYEIKRLAEPNEAGFYNPDYFTQGTYVLTYVFRLHPPIEYDENFAHLNLKLATIHLKYEDVEIILENSSHVLEVYLHPPSFNVNRVEEKIIIRGVSRQDELLELELISDKELIDFLDGFPNEVPGVRERTRESNAIYSLQFSLASIQFESSRSLIVIMPILLFLTYLIYGRERRFIVPRYLSTVPNKIRKPWEVNLVFKDDAFGSDEYSLYATLLDLSMSGKIKIETKNEHLSIRVLDDKSNDKYENILLKFLSDNSVNGIFNTNSIKKLTENAEIPSSYHKLLLLRENIIKLTNYRSDEISSRYAINGRKNIIRLMAIPVLTIFLSLIFSSIFHTLSNYFLEAIPFGVVALAQCVVAFPFPSTLFGKWKGEFYKEKLEWGAFRNFLSELAMIRKYFPQDLSMWGEWLIYGTALGVGENVAKVMKELKLNVEIADTAIRMPVLFRPVMAIALPTRVGGGGRSWSRGGGFGAGGGFGGGGGGVR